MLTWLVTLLSGYELLVYRAKRSWFANFRSEREKEEEVVVVFRDKSFQELKGSIKQAFTVSVYPYC